MTSRSIAPTAHHSNKETHSSSNGGGDNDPPHSTIDSSHKLPVEKKRKKNVGQAEEPKMQSQNIEVDTDLDAMLPFLDQPQDDIHHSHLMDMSVTQNFDEDESFVFQSVVFDSRNKRLIFEKKMLKISKENLVQRLTLPTCGCPKYVNFTLRPKKHFMIPLDASRPRMPN
jgi:hypothetical protein